jgi:uncharacterized protein
VVAIDALRGLALFGVLIVNLVSEFRVSIFQQFLPSLSNESPLDQCVDTALSFLFSLKALALFSLLFGAGLAIQFERLARNPQRTLLLIRRLAALLVFGLVHLFLIWNGDILTEYAVAGFLVLPFLFGSCWLLAGAAAAFLGLYLALALPPSLTAFPSAAWMAVHVRAATNAYGTGGFAEVLAFRIAEVAQIFPLHISIFPRTVALFFIGALLWRTGALRHLERHAGLWLTGGVALWVLGAGLDLAARGHAPFAPASFGAWTFFLNRSAPIFMALGYGGIVLGIMSTDARGLFLWAAPLGRMAFTNYLLQSIVLGWIFYGYGLGLFGQLGVVAALVIGIVLYACQVLLSIWWLGHWRFGPVEWVWRSLMYCAAQPMRTVS